MTDWQERVVVERATLKEKESKLAVFLIGATVNSTTDHDFGLLSLQHKIMQSYLEVLDLRISRFN